MRRLFLFLLFLALVAYGQEQKRVAIMRTVDDGEPEVEPTELIYLTGRLREIAGNILQNNYGIMTEQNIIDKLGGREIAVQVCKETEGCLAKLGVKISANYIGQARLGRFGDSLTINMELYNAGSSTLIGSFTGKAKNVSGLEVIMNEKAPAMFRKMPGVSDGRIFEGGTYGVQVEGADYEFAGKKRYVANITSDPEGAGLSFNGVPAASCKETPCKVELGEGSVRIIANLEQYEIADTTVSIKQNNQSIRIRMKANFGVLEIKPAYLDGIGRDELWSLAINGKTASSWESRLSPNKYKVELSHRCYEAVSFEAGINRDKREVFDMASHIRLKKGGLVLSAEADGEPVSEPVFVNGVQVGETPFSGSVPVCAKIEIGAGREEVNVNIKYNKSVKYTHKMNTEERRRRLAVEQQARYEEEQRELELEQERQEQERKKQEKLAMVKEPYVFGVGLGAYLNMKNVNPAFRNIGHFLISINSEFVSVADGRLSFGVDVDFSFEEQKEDTLAIFRGGTSAKLLFMEYRWLYLTTGVGWSYAGGESYSAPSFSVGGGLRVPGVFFDVQYYIVSLNNRNAGYWAIKCGMSMPYSMLKMQSENSGDERKVRKRK